MKYVCNCGGFVAVNLPLSYMCMRVREECKLWLENVYILVGVILIAGSGFVHDTTSIP